MTREQLNTIHNVAGLLGGLRKASKRSTFDGGMTLVSAEALLWIYSGIDHLSDLQNLMGLTPARVSRCLSLLRGRGRKGEDGRWIESKLGLVKVTNHPHRRGYRLELTDEAVELLDSTFAPLNRDGDH
jgi:DNA-binding MarR family transcriptional regulator